MNTYSISVTTSNIRGAGTDANVYIELIGRRDVSGKILLKNSKTNPLNKFEQGKTDIFEINCPDVGTLKRIRIGHDNKGFGPGWHLKKVEIEKPDGNRWIFPCNKWFDKKEDDGLIERELYPLEYIQDKADRVHGHIGNALNYDLIVKTSDIRYAGTDSNIYLKIYGEYRKSDYIVLDKSLSHANKFERGNADRFSLREEFFGEIDKIKIKKDNKGAGANWHLNEVTLECAELGRKWIFPYNEWVKGDGDIEIVLKPLNNKMSISDSDLKVYVIEVFTGDLPQSGTDANVYITLFGEELESTEKHLNVSKTHRNKFERNNMDRFTFETIDLGRLVGIRIRHDNTGALADWFLDRVEILDESVQEKYIFICEKWLSTRKDDCKIDRFIKEMNYKNKTKDKKPSLKPKDKKKPTKKPPTKLEFFKTSKQYFIKIYTGSGQPKSGTDINGYIKFFGDTQVSKLFRLTDTKTHDEKFNRNQIDLFVIESDQDFGNLYAIELKLEQCLKTANDFHLKKVEVSDGFLTYNFIYNNFVTIKDTEYGYKKLILLEENAQF